MSNNKFNNQVERSKEGDAWFITGDIVVEGTKYLIIRKTKFIRQQLDYFIRESDYNRKDWYKTFIPCTRRL